MCGRETLAMLVSNTSMNVAMVTTSAMIHAFTAGLVEAGMAGAAMAVSLIAPGPWAWKDKCESNLCASQCQPGTDFVFAGPVVGRQ
jgi:hypothetical protein